MAHVVWDWNGTLLADLDVSVDAVNVVMKAFGRNAITAEDYARHYERPVRRFYEHLLDGPLDEPTWARVNELWHDHYHRHLEAIPLAQDAIETLERIADDGHTQSLLSMWMHDRLVAECERRKITKWFTRIDGDMTRDGGRKKISLAEHVASLEDTAVANIVVIGDTIDDAEAAHAVGARAVLITATTHPDRLDGAGALLINGLAELAAHL